MAGFWFSSSQSLVIHQFQNGFTSSCEHHFFIYRLRIHLILSKSVCANIVWKAIRIDLERDMDMLRKKSKSLLLLEQESTVSIIPPYDEWKCFFIETSATVGGGWFYHYSIVTSSNSSLKSFHSWVYFAQSPVSCVSTYK